MKKLLILLLATCILLCACGANTPEGDNKDQTGQNNNQNNSQTGSGENENTAADGKEENKGAVSIKAPDGYDVLEAGEASSLGITLADVSDSELAKEYGLYDFIDREIDKDYVPPRTLTVTLPDDRELEGSFSGKTAAPYVHATRLCYEYKTEDGKVFETLSDGTLVAYIGHSAFPPAFTVTEDAALAKAKELAAKVIDIEGYTLTTEHSEYSYTFCFRKYVGDIKTVERLYIDIDGNGELVGYNAIGIGAIGADAKADFDMAEIKRGIANTMLDQYKGMLRSADKAFYKVGSVILTKLKTGEYALVCNVYLEFATVENDLVSFDGVSATFVVTK